ncbi:MAG: flagellin [Candidatus Latescibacteria bacterium]|jgi:flagellin|nr:flagellin [Candidatus Latescibacterota bacterium]MBT4139257.1 flagellin [Candidatus Latescibacterota bacterium]
MAGLMVNHNIMAMNSQRHLGNNNSGLSMRIERLSSGLRINRAADDASGLSVSEAMRAEIGGIRTGTKNAEQGTNMIQTAEGALNEVSAILIRMRELSVQSASSTVNDNNRDAINAEFTQLTAEIDRISASTQYNNTSLLQGFGNVVNADATVSTALASPTTGVVDATLTGATAGTYVFVDGGGTDNEITLGNGVTTQTIDLGAALDSDAAGGVVATNSSIVANFDRLGIQLTLSGQQNAGQFNPATDGYRDGELDGLQLVVDGNNGGTIQVGADARATDRIELTVANMSSGSTGLNLSATSLSSLEGSRTAISSIDLAIDIVSSTRADLGVQQNRLAYTIRNNNVSLENIQASESLIRDADIASEVTELTRSQILTQANTSLLAQANAAPQSALTLLQ